jgi:hypothetical protein
VVSAHQPDYGLMRLGLGSGADPDATAAELAEACARRGLHALEVSAADDAFASLDQFASADLGHGVTLVGILAAAAATEDATAMARRLAVPVIMDRGGDNGDNAAAVAAASVTAVANVSAVPLMRGAAEEWLQLLPASMPFAWQVDESVPDPAGDAARLLRLGSGPVLIRLVGGGPETALQDGRGVGALMRVLALAGYTGPLVVTPSSRRYRVAWSSWLGRRGGWGCGSSGDARTTTSLHLTGVQQ